MAKSQYSVKVEPYLELIEGWTREGLVMSQIAEKLGISKTTLYKYMQEHSELSERLKKGREVSDAQVENELFKKAVGFTRIEKKPFKVKKVDYEEVVMVDQEVYYPPELGAQVFWLKNRKPDKWREKVENKIETEEDGVGVMILTPVKEAEDE